MKNLNMWYNEGLDEFAKVALSGLLSNPETTPGNVSYHTARQAFLMAQYMMEVREEFQKKD